MTTTVWRANYHNPFSGADGLMEIYPTLEELWRARNTTTGMLFNGASWRDAAAARAMLNHILNSWGWDQTSEWEAAIVPFEAHGLAQGIKVQ
jgi:hypothetical protein